MPPIEDHTPIRAANASAPEVPPATLAPVVPPIPVIPVARPAPPGSTVEMPYEFVEVAPRPRRRKWPRIALTTRLLLAVMALACSAVLATALWLRPYHENGEARSMETHTQLGLPPCNMVVLLGRPCPACGMTTSFSLLAHGDVRASLRANWVGTLLAGFVWGLIPWGFACALRGRLLWVRNPELTLTLLLSALLVLMVLRWIWIMATWSDGS